VVLGIGGRGDGKALSIFITLRDRPSLPFPPSFPPSLLTKHEHLPTILNDVIAQRIQVAILHARKQVGVVACLSQLHHQIKHGGAAGRFGAGNDREITFQDFLVGVTLVRGREGGGAEREERGRRRVK